MNLRECPRKQRSRAPFGSVLKLSSLCVPAALTAVLSFWNVQALGLSWWDEYDYVLTAKWFVGRPDGVFTIYEPPGFPFFISLMFRFFGVKDFVAVATSGVFAVLTVVLVTYIGFKWFGYGVGLAASVLLAINSMFLMFSRFAMTDMTLTFFFTVAVYTVYVALKSRRRRDLLLGAIGLACCASIKYNGSMAFFVPLAYIPILAMKEQKPIRALSRSLLLFVSMALPTLVFALGFVVFLGVGGSIHQFFAMRTIKLLAANLPALLQIGFGKFVTGAILHAHNGPQLMFIPFGESLFYLAALTQFVQWPLLIAFVVGLVAVMWTASGQEELRFLIFWLVMVFFLVTSIPLAVSRAIVPILTPMSLIAAIGIMSLPRALPAGLLKHLHGGSRLPQAISAGFLLIVLIASCSSTIQTVSITHGAYREAGTFLSSIARGGSVLADTQLVLAFYYPVNFGTGLGPPTNATISKQRFLVVDFEASTLGYDQAIRQLESEGRITLVASIPNDVPEIVYLDRMTFAQYDALNGTFIYIYRVNNITQTMDG